MLNRRLVIVFPLLAALAAPAQAVPTTINYQGRLTDNTPAQTPVSATVQMQFAIFDAASGGTRLWQEPAADNTGTPIVVNGGIFDYVLGNAVAIAPSVFTGATSVRYLQITLSPAASPEILAPRQRITATGYANLAANAGSAVNATTVTNGVYTTGSYADPAWITSLAGTKITGSVANATNSASLGGVAATGWQKALATNPCPAGQSYSGIAADGTATCSAPATVGHMFTSNIINPTTNNNVQFCWNPNGYGNVTGLMSTLDVRVAAMPVACTFDTLFVSHQANTAQNNMAYTYALVVNGATTALTCGLSTVSGSTITCSDTSHTVPVVAGALIAFMAVTTSTSVTPIGNIRVSARCR